ncbi:MAG: tetratricopeptide repeat protein, partial [Bdellovibrionales bacterium]
MMNVFWPTLLSLIVASQLASAVKMDETTHDMVIQRLELGLDGMDKNEPDRNGIVLRLAELYADRARLKAMNEMDAACQDCKGAFNDRKKSISLYQEALAKTDKKEQGKVVLQIAHLYSLNDNGKKSGGLYSQILNAKKNTFSSEVRAIALANVGEKKFRNGDFKGALKDFENARKEKLQTKALIEFRIAWCQLNLGQTDKAIKTLTALLQNPDLLATQTTDGKSVDPIFVQDVSRDLAIFLARTDVGISQIATLKKLSPEAVRKSNLKALATETDRLGKKSSSLIVWAAYVDEGEVTPAEKLEVQTRVAQIYYDMNKQELAANAYEKALDLWKKLGCTDEKVCPDLKIRLKKFVTAWNKGQKKKPTENLFRAYQAYNQTFVNETEMIQWQAVVGRDLGKHKESAALFHQAAVLAQADLAKNSNDKVARQIFEASLLTEIEMAEKSKDLKARENAYNYYLQQNPNGSQAFEVRYQRAQVYYSSNRFQEAFSEFHYLASQPIKEHKDLRVKSADLALDCLVAMKDDKNLQVRSLEYARFFPERKTEYLKISRKATMTLVASNMKNDKANDRTDYKANLTALAAVNMDGADDSEKIKFYKNKITIAQKALDLNTVKETSAKLLGVKTLKADDREWTNQQQVWVAELELNFAEAYRLSRQMNLSELSKADRELRLALLAELAGLDAHKHHEAYIKLAGNGRSANLVRVTLIRASSNPWRELEKQSKYLSKSADLYAGITLEVFAGHPDANKANR